MTRNNSPGLWPKGVSDNQFLFSCFSGWDVYIPYPSQGHFGWQSLFLMMGVAPVGGLFCHPEFASILDPQKN
jgi:hypothetical protein